MKTMVTPLSFLVLQLSDVTVVMRILRPCQPWEVHEEPRLVRWPPRGPQTEGLVWFRFGGKTQKGREKETRAYLQSNGWVGEVKNCPF